MYNFFKYNYTSKFRLIGKINGLADDARRTRFHLLERVKKEKPVYILAARKRAVSDDTRHHLLAYAFMRGTLYQQLECKTRKDNKPSAGKILDIVRMHAPSRVWRIEDIQQWLSSEVQ